MFQIFYNEFTSTKVIIILTSGLLIIIEQEVYQYLNGRKRVRCGGKTDDENGEIPYLLTYCAS